MTTTDPVGLLLNRLGWQRSLLRPPTLRPDPRLAWTLETVLGAEFGSVERRGLRGAAYTVVFGKR